MGSPSTVSCVPFRQRRSGLLLHPTSLPGGQGVGDIGPSAHRFVEFLAHAGQTYWQMLPVCPTGSALSPYDSPSSVALNPLLLSLPENVIKDTMRESPASTAPVIENDRHARFDQALATKNRALRILYQRFERQSTPEEQQDYRNFCGRNASWLEDHALFFALKERFSQAPWVEWPPALRDREAEALERARWQMRSTVGFHRFVQFELDRQWLALRQCCNRHGIVLMGDMPIYVAHDSVDVWSHRDVFDLDECGERRTLAGVPPDYFCQDGQLWGNPIYRWSRLAETGFAWWIARFRVTLQRFDAIRLDHFIGLRQFWEVPATARTAKTGRFVRAPGEEFLATLRSVFGGLPLLAEDLGIVTEEVHALRNAFDLPGMRVLQFAFDDPAGSDYLPHRYHPNTAVYTGTHDNDTTVGWFRAAEPLDPRAREAHRAVRRRALDYLGSDGREIHWDLVRLSLRSVARTAIFPVQDLLGLGSEARMNTPGTTEGNWRFRLLEGELDERIAARLRALCVSYERMGSNSG